LVETYVILEAYGYKTFELLNDFRMDILLPEVRKHNFNCVENWDMRKHGDHIKEKES